MIKPNLVSNKTAEAGANTDPQVVCALVDLALESDATSVLIVESAPGRAHFSDAGYDFLSDYDKRVALADMGDRPVGLFSIAGSMAYRWLYMPKPVMNPDIVFISAAKLKTHGNAIATLTMKNLFGLPAEPFYRNPPTKPLGRFAMHNLSVNQTIIDLNLARSVDFAVVDGIWGMEGFGPVFSQPVKMDVVVAGANALAVDRTCLEIMRTSRRRGFNTLVMGREKGWVQRT